MRSSSTAKHFALACIFATLVAIGPLLSASAHPLSVTITTGTVTYYTFGHEWRTQQDWDCGGRYTLQLGGRMYCNGSSLTVYDARFRAYNLDDANPTKTSSVYILYGGAYDYNDDKNGWTIPTTSNLVAYHTWNTTTSSDPNSGFSIRYHTFAGGFDHWPCGNNDRVFYLS